MTVQSPASKSCAATSSGIVLLVAAGGLLLPLTSGCGPKAASPAERYVAALNYREQGNAEAYYSALIALAADEPNSRAGRRARVTLGGGGDVVTGLWAAGVVSAIAVPNFLKFQARARTSEAKQLLRNMAVQVRDLAASENRVCNSWETCDLTVPDGSRYLYYLSASEVRGGDGATDAAVLRGRADALLETMQLQPGINDNGFLFVAVGDVDDDAQLDVWTIDDDLNLVHVIDDVQ